MVFCSLVRLGYIAGKIQKTILVSRFRINIICLNFLHFNFGSCQGEDWCIHLDVDSHSAHSGSIELLVITAVCSF